MREKTSYEQMRDDIILGNGISMIVSAIVHIALLPAHQKKLAERSEKKYQKRLAKCYEKDRAAALIEHEERLKHCKEWHWTKRGKFDVVEMLLEYEDPVTHETKIKKFVQWGDYYNFFGGKPSERK